MSIESLIVRNEINILCFVYIYFQVSIESLIVRNEINILCFVYIYF